MTGKSENVYEKLAYSNTYTIVKRLLPEAPTTREINAALSELNQFFITKHQQPIKQAAATDALTDWLAKQNVGSMALLEMDLIVARHRSN